MDNHTDVPEVQPGGGQPGSLRALKIVPKDWAPERLQWLWKCLMTQDHAFDDFSEKYGAQVFIAQLFSPSSVWYELGDFGIACFSGVRQDCDTIFHFSIWDEVEPHALYSLLRNLFYEMFQTFNLRRITAMVPDNNKPAIRAAILNGFKYEGEMRKAYLKHSVWHNIQIYGLLREEFTKRGVIN